jgi:DNA ligase (NAD+)
VYSASDQQHLNQLSISLIKNEKHLSTAHEVEALRSVLRYHDWRYYVLSEPLVTDRDYDTLFTRLKELEAVHPDLDHPDSPTQRVAKGLTEDFAQVAHLASMLSLENSYNAEDVIDFDRKVTRADRQ